MSKLPKSIIKKYGISKKAWTVFRNSSSSTRTVTKRRGITMARRKRSFGKRAMRYARASAKGSTLIQLDSMLYGAARAKIATAIQPVTSMLPLGSIADEVAMGLALWFGAKYLPQGIIRDVAHKGLSIENARIGEQLVSGNIFGSTSTNNNLWNGGTA